MKRVTKIEAANMVIPGIQIYMVYQKIEELV